MKIRNVCYTDLKSKLLLQSNYVQMSFSVLPSSDSKIKNRTVCIVELALWGRGAATKMVMEIAPFFISSSLRLQNLSDPLKWKKDTGFLGSVVEES